MVFKSIGLREYYVLTSLHLRDPPAHPSVYPSVREMDGLTMVPLLETAKMTYPKSRTKTSKKICDRKI